MIKSLSASQTDAQPPVAPAPRIHLNYLDGMRGLAAFWVVCSHLWHFQHVWEPGRFGLVSNWLSYAHLAVDMFIVLSGFCLVIPVARNGRLTGGVIDFYKRRARRILPPFYACLAFSLALGLITDHLGHGYSIPITLKSTLANLFLLQDIFPNLDTINIPLWSVALEWKIYFLFPVVIWLWQRYGPVAALSGAAVAGYGLMGLLLWHLSIREQALTCPWYLLLFATGVCAGFYAFKEKPDTSQQKMLAAWRGAFVGSGLLLACLLHTYPIWTNTSAAFDNYFRHLPIIDPVAGVFVASLLVLLHNSTRGGMALARKLLSWPPLVFVGTFSYSLYLMHLPILDIVRIAVDRVHPLSHSPNLQLAAIAVIGLPLTLVGSYLFHLKFEKPFMRT